QHQEEKARDGARKGRQIARMQADHEQEQGRTDRTGLGGGVHTGIQVGQTIDADRSDQRKERADDDQERGEQGYGVSDHLFPSPLAEPPGFLPPRGFALTGTASTAAGLNDLPPLPFAFCPPTAGPPSGGCSPTMPRARMKRAKPTVARKPTRPSEMAMSI